MKHILIGTITLEKDVEMYNNQFQYAASYEKLNVPKGEYPIYTLESEIEERRGRYEVKGAYLGFEGTVLSSNVGGKPGEHSYYSQFGYGYSMAQMFLDGHDYSDGFCKGIRREWTLRPEWKIEISDFNSCIDGKRLFSLSLALKEGAEFTYMD